MRKSVLLTTGLVMVLACGFSPQVSKPVQSSYVSIDYVNISTDTLSLGTSFTVDWKVSYSSPSGIYSVEAYLSPTQELPSNYSDYELFRHNCGSGPLYPCDNKGSVKCTYSDNRTTGEPIFECSSYRSTIYFIGSGYFIFKACIYNENLDYVCDKRVIPVTLN